MKTKSQFPLTIVPVHERWLAVLFLLNAVLSAIVGTPTEAFLWTMFATVFFCACYQQARAEHYKKLCQRAEAIFQAQLNGGQDHNPCGCRKEKL